MKMILAHNILLSSVFEGKQHSKNKIQTTSLTSLEVSLHPFFMIGTDGILITEYLLLHSDVLEMFFLFNAAVSGSTFKCSFAQRISHNPKRVNASFSLLFRP